MSIPRVVLTSNGTRELSDALRRRCLYHYVDFPEVDREARIILTRLPGIDTALAQQIARMVATIRKEDLRKVPGVAETLDWAATLAGLDVHDLRQEPEAVQETMICLLKTHEDRSRVTREVSERCLARWREMAACRAAVSSDRPRSAKRCASSSRASPARSATTASRSGWRKRAMRWRSCVAGRRQAIVAQPALRALFCADHSDWERFDEIFDASGAAHGMRQRDLAALGGEPARRCGALPRRGVAGAGRRCRITSNVARRRRQRPAGRGRREGASRSETLATTDMRHIVDPDDIARTHALAARLARTMRARLMRREQMRRRGPRLDLRRTIHRNVSHGGTPVDLAWRRRKSKPLRLVVLLDASGSMSLYTAFFVRFLHGVVDAFREAEAFVFHTRLAHVSPSLRDRNVTRAVDKLPLMAQGIGGGTRIGESLATFNRWHARRVINSRTAVMIVSDGYDTGEPEQLGDEMRRLRRRCRRIIWLNPLIGWRDYSPQARGMQAALPYVDLFAPAHNLESLAALEPYLARI